MTEGLERLIAEARRQRDLLREADQKQYQNTVPNPGAAIAPTLMWEHADLFNRLAIALARLQLGGGKGRSGTVILPVQRDDKSWDVWECAYYGTSSVPSLERHLAGPFEARDAATNWIEDQLSPSPQAGGEPLDGRAAQMLTEKGWKAGDQLSIASVLALMADFGTEVRRRPLVGAQAVAECAEEADLRGLVPWQAPQAGGGLREALERIKTIAAAATHDGWNSTRLADIKVHANRALAALSQADASQGGEA